MNRAETARVLYLLDSQWTDHVTDNDVINAYQLALADLDVELVQAAAVWHMRGGSPFYPRAGELRKIIAEALIAPDINPETAYEEVLREIKRVGAYPRPFWAGGIRFEAPKPRFSSPLIAKAVAAIGWVELCTAQSSDTKTVRAQFREALRVTIETERRSVQIGALDDLSPLAALSPEHRAASQLLNRSKGEPNELEGSNRRQLGDGRHE